ncbi:MAG: hypothetical protein AB4372_11305 [Xenococcus sp. (in: cyanobacteria)]
MKIVLLGNAGAGKSTMAKGLVGKQQVAILSLDEIAWNEGMVRKPLSESIVLLNAFIDKNEQWIIEGCYSELVAAALPYCDELRFLNPGIQLPHLTLTLRRWGLCLHSTAIPSISEDI